MVEIRANLERLQHRIQEACRRAGRAEDEVTLVAVSKTFPIDRIRAALDAGQAHFGENKVQELASKREAWDGGDAFWHMIGHLQRNKAGLVARHADMFHALDSEKLAIALDRRCREEGRVLPCLVQVNVSGEDSKFGVQPDALSGLLQGLGRFDALEVTGLMTLAAPAPDPEEIRPQFRLLRRLAAENQGRHAGIRLDNLSMGMSGDFEIAIEEGATHVRVGSAIFGSRSYL